MNEFHELFRWNQIPKRPSRKLRSQFQKAKEQKSRKGSDGLLLDLHLRERAWARGHERPCESPCADPSINTEALGIRVWVCVHWNGWSQGYILSYTQCGDRSPSSLIFYFICTKLLETSEALSGPENCWWISRFVECYKLQLIISFCSESIVPHKFL